MPVAVDAHHMIAVRTQSHTAHQSDDHDGRTNYLVTRMKAMPITATKLEWLSDFTAKVN